MNLNIKKFVITGLLFLLVACGSDNDSGNALLTGQFVDGSVSGLSYSTATQTGVTGVDGLFSYLAGETVTFSIGNMILGSAPAKAVISPFDLVPGAEPVEGNARISKAVFDKKSGYRKVVNMTVLLQTLDYDGDADNGIEITANVASLFANLNVDFDSDWSQFQHEVDFRRALNSANNLGMLSGHRQVIKAWYAMEHLYNTLGLSAPQAKAKTEVIANVDNGEITSITETIYDAKGNRLRDERDNDADGEPDSVTSYVYDVNDNQTFYEDDTDANGVANSGTRYIYDVDGNQVRSEIDDPADGIVDSVTLSAYDASGNLTRYEEDVDNNGVMNRISIYSYDESGNQTLFEYDTNANGIADIKTSYSYDVDGNQILSEKDDPADGVIDSVIKNTYDVSGRRTLQEFDNNNDKTIDRIITRSYDDSGNLTRYEDDSDNDGEANRIFTYAYDDSGNQTRLEIDSEGDGIANSISISFYDVNGYLIRSENDTDGDGSVNSAALYTNTVLGGWEFVLGN